MQFSRGISSLTRALSSLQIGTSAVSRPLARQTCAPTPLSLAMRATPSRFFSSSPAASATLNQVSRGARKPVRRKTASPALEHCPQKKGVCTKVRRLRCFARSSSVLTSVGLSTGVHDEAQEAQLCHAKGRKGQADDWAVCHLLHPGRGAQPARAQRRHDPRRTHTRLPWCQVSLGNDSDDASRTVLMASSRSITGTRLFVAPWTWLACRVGPCPGPSMAVSALPRPLLPCIY